MLDSIFIELRENCLRKLRYMKRLSIWSSLGNFSLWHRYRLLRLGDWLQQYLGSGLRGVKLLAWLGLRSITWLWLQNIRLLLSRTSVSNPNLFCINLVRLGRSLT